MSIYDRPKFDLATAQTVESELRSDYPENQWSENYITGIIRLCCQGDDYFDGHHDAYRRYLRKLGLYQNHCAECGLDFYSPEPEDWCSEACEQRYYT